MPNRPPRKKSDKVFLKKSQVDYVSPEIDTLPSILSITIFDDDVRDFFEAKFEEVLEYGSYINSDISGNRFDYAITIGEALETLPSAEKAIRNKLKQLGLTEDQFTLTLHDPRKGEDRYLSEEEKKWKEGKVFLSKEAAQFKDLFSSKYVSWIKTEINLLAANNWEFSSVETANANIDKAIKELAKTIQQAIEPEITRIIADERDDILTDLTENVVAGPNLPQMGPSTPAPVPTTEAIPAEDVPKSISPPPASRRKRSQTFVDDSGKISINTLEDAQTFVSNSGVVDWAWTGRANPEGFAEYIYENCNVIDVTNYEAELGGYLVSVGEDPYDYGTAYPQASKLSKVIKALSANASLTLNEAPEDIYKMKANIDTMLQSAGINKFEAALDNGQYKFTFDTEDEAKIAHDVLDSEGFNVILNGDVGINREQKSREEEQLLDEAPQRVSKRVSMTKKLAEAFDESERKGDNFELDLSQTQKAIDDALEVDLEEPEAHIAPRKASRYRIYNTSSGEDLGVYEGVNEEEALQNMYVDAGYPTGVPPEEVGGFWPEDIMVEQVARKASLFYNTKEEFGEPGPFDATSKEELADEMLPLFHIWAEEEWLDLMEQGIDSVDLSERDEQSYIDESVSTMYVDFIEGLEEVGNRQGRKADKFDSDLAESKKNIDKALRDPLDQPKPNIAPRKAALELRPVGSNMTEVETDTVVVLFSYSTPVAYMDKTSGQCFRTSEKFSNTTTRHINKWLEGRPAEEVDQAQIEGLVQTANAETYSIESMDKKDAEKILSKVVGQIVDLEDFKKDILEEQELEDTLETKDDMRQHTRVQYNELEE